MLLLALCAAASAQTYDEEQFDENFSLNQPLDNGISYHYTASGVIDLTPGFDYTPDKGKAALFEVDPMGMFPPTYGTTVSAAQDQNGNIQGGGGMPYSLPMTADVNDNGAAVIKIPIDCPPGVNGMQPDLSFVYNSQAGDGIMGPGWSIGGMSKISRVPYKYHYSDYSNAVSFTDNDDFSLDGNRLIRATNNNKVYYLETFDNSVVRYNSSNKSFTIEKPNGFVYTYGGTENSKNYVINNQNDMQPVEWHLNMIKDPYGNNINFAYDKDDDGGFYPSRITYGGYTIEFEYHSALRTDTQKKFFTDNTGKIGYSKITKALSVIKFMRGDEAVHSYHLTYIVNQSESEFPSRELTYIQKYGSHNEAGGKPYAENCTASCEFVWDNNAGVLQVDKDCKDVFLSQKLQVGDSFYPDKVFAAHFMDGEEGNPGLSDVVMLLRQNVNPFYMMYVLKNKSVNYAEEHTYLYSFNLISDENDEDINGFLKDKNNCEMFSPVDVDGDGYNEILYIYCDQYNYHARLITYNHEIHKFVLSDNDIPDIPSLNNARYDFFIGDYDGNGCSDLLLTNGDFTRVCLSVDGAFNTVVDRPDGLDLYLNSSNHREYVGDFTGDGRDQLVSMMKFKTSTGDCKYYTRNVNIVKSNGEYAMEISERRVSDLAAYLFRPENKCVHLCQGDFNGDNKQDFVALMSKEEDHNWYFYLSKGDGGSFEKKTWYNQVGYDEIADKFVPIAADFNGDGFTDLSMTRVIVEDYPQNQSNSHTYDFYYRYDFLIRADDSGIKVVRKSVLDEEGNEQYAGRSQHNGNIFENKYRVFPCLGNFRGTSPSEIAYIRLYDGWAYDDIRKDNRYLHMRMWNTGDFDNPPLNAIVCAKNGLGVSTQYEYIQHTYQGLDGIPSKRRSSQINYTRPYTSHLDVVRIMSDETDEGVSRKTRFSFKQPIMHTRGKGLLGFMTVGRFVESQGNNSSNDYVITTKTFSINSDYYVLYPSKIQRHRHPNLLISESEYTCDFRNLNTAYDGMPDKVFLPVMTTEKNTNHSNGTVTTTKYSNFNNYGHPQNVTQTVVTDNPATETYKKTDVYVYDNVETAGCRLIGLVKSHREMYRLGTGNDVTINTSYDYDSKGYMTKRVANGVEERFTPDSHGNTTAIKRTADGETRTVTMTYSDDGRFMETSTDAMENTTSYQYIDRNGLLRSETDPNGLVTTYHYDMLGNVTDIDYPDGTKEMFVRRWTKTADNNPYYEHPDMPSTGCPVYYTWSKRNGQPEITAFYDQHDRLLRTVTRDLNRRKVFTDRSYYDKSGLLKTESLPYFGDDEKPSGHTTYSYDYLDRIISIEKPGCETYTHSYSGNTETVTGFDGQKKKVVYFPNGKPYSVTDNDAATVEYVYYGDGNVKSTKVGGNDKTKIEYTYDANRHPQSMSDPSLGMRTYSYNAFGELRSETNAKMQVTSYSYDALGRMTQRSDDDGTTTWQYDGQMAGLLDNTVYEPARPDDPVVTETFEYDGLGRTVRQKQAFGDEEPLTFSYGYNIYGHRNSVTYPSGYTLSYRYDTDGNMLSVKDLDGNGILWTADSTDKFGNLSDFTLGKDISVDKIYDDQTGLIRSISASNGRVIQNMKYEWDTKGNMFSRSDLVARHSETFTYDKFNRLTDIETDGRETYSVLYDNLGNVKSKYDAGTMRYGNASNPYAVDRISDAPDITLFKEPQDVKYTSFDKVMCASQGANTLQISYGADRQRVRQTISTSNTEETKRYFTPLYEEVTEKGATKRIHYLTSTTGLFAIFAAESEKDGVMNYILKDHQGSMYASVTGNTVERYGFDAWGRRRNPQTLSYDNVSVSYDRGFTLHEHYDDFGLINMNGRVYDPLVGRMLSPDILIQDPELSQAYNRYSYCLNNPLRFTDPSGYVVDWYEKNGKIIWDDNVTCAANTPMCGTYIGPDDKDILKYYGLKESYERQSASRFGVSLNGVSMEDDHNGNLYPNQSPWLVPTIPSDNVDGYLTASAVVSYNTDEASGTNKYGKTFEGITFHFGFSQSGRSLDYKGTVKLQYADRIEENSLKIPKTSQPRIGDAERKFLMSEITVPASEIVGRNCFNNASISAGAVDRTILFHPRPVELKWNLNVPSTTQNRFTFKYYFLYEK